ncbi:MAG TPA: hypothetical protein VFX59_22275 [Polyangiales bacterium]|nr:hypothetical protein [Polyangiales bacterium]
MRLRHLLLAVVATIATIELGYLVYANLQLESAFDEFAGAADVRVDYDQAYTKYPGDAQLRGLRIASRESDSWSLYLDRAELSLYPTLPSMHWSGVLIVPSQIAHLQLGTRVLPLRVRGDLRLRDLRGRQGSSDGGHLHLRSVDGERGKAAEALTADLTITEAELSRTTPLRVRGEIIARGDDAQLLWSAWESERVHGLTAFAGEPWTMFAHLSVDPGLLALEGIYVRAVEGSVRGRYRYDGQQHGRFLVVPLAGDELDLELRDGALFRERPPGGVRWLEPSRSTQRVPRRQGCANASCAASVVLADQ